MGQVHSEEYQLELDESSEDVGDSELNSPTTPKPEVGSGRAREGVKEFKRKQESAGRGSKSGLDCKKQASSERKQQEQYNDEHARKLSNVSHRNIQLLSMKPHTEIDAYADGLKNRRRSSLINLILGAPSRGPRFSDDLCSLSSRQISEFNFGIEFFPESIYQQHGASLAATPSISSIMGFPFGGPPSANQAEQQQQQHQQPQSSAEEGRAKLSKIPVKATISSPLAIVNSGGGGGDDGGLPEAAKSRRRRSSIGSLAMAKFISSHGTAAYENYSHQGFDDDEPGTGNRGPAFANEAPSRQATVVRQSTNRKPSLSSMLNSIDLTSSFEQHDKSPRLIGFHAIKPAPLSKAKQTIFESISQESLTDPPRDEFNSRLTKGRVNKLGRVLRRTGSELSLYSTVSGASATPSTRSCQTSSSSAGKQASLQGPQQIKETKLIIMLQVCLPFILAGFGNMAAGLVLNRVAHWRAFQIVPIFFVLLPSFVGLKGNIEMTLASRLSTLSNLNLLKTKQDQKRAYLSNLVLILSQAIGLSVFASVIAILCEVFISGSIHIPATTMTTSARSLTNFNEFLDVSLLIVLPSALTTAIILVLISSIIMSLAIGLANLIQVNPDNLSTLIAALYGDVSCVFIYGLVADWIFSLHEQGIVIWPVIIISSALLLWPILLYAAYKLKETHTIALSSIPPMLASIMISMGSGAILSIVVGKFSLIALYQPVVNGFGANLIAVQASRVSTWLWCSALRRLSLGVGRESTRVTDLVGSEKKLSASLATFTEPAMSGSKQDHSIEKRFQLSKMWDVAKRILKTILWSFYNSSPNSIAAKLLLIMLVPAHSLYFMVIWLVSDYVTLTIPFYLIYVSLCLLQVFTLLTICEPLMTLLMRRHMDPDIFGISILMALADLIGTICLTGAFFLLASLGDVNAIMK